MTDFRTLIGCSGYYYPAWRVKFYPEELQPKEWLQFYSSVFNTVELNGTFYRIPTPGSLKKQYEATPTDFKFSVKMSKQITHFNKLKETKTLIAEFQNLIKEHLKEKVSHFLFQLPPSFQYSEDNLKLLLENIPNSSENVVEFRHISWWNKTVQQKLEEADITFCNVNFPGMETFIIQTTSRFYLRLHGNPVLFKSSYAKEELEKFRDEIPGNSESVSVYFNNTYYEAGYTNARELRKLIESHSEQL